MKKWKRDGKKGFTLVELIVVLVILAILAALLIPALTGYIDKAKEKQIIAETRQVVMSAQTLVDEYYGTKNVADNVEGTVDGTKFDSMSMADIAQLAEVNAINIKSITVGSSLDDKLSGIITEVKYERDGKLCTYTKTTADAVGTYKVESATP